MKCRGQRAGRAVGQVGSHEPAVGVVVVGRDEAALGGLASHAVALVLGEEPLAEIGLLGIDLDGRHRAELRGRGLARDRADSAHGADQGRQNQSSRESVKEWCAYESIPLVCLVVCLAPGPNAPPRAS